MFENEVKKLNFEIDALNYAIQRKKEELSEVLFEKHLHEQGILEKGQKLKGVIGLNIRINKKKEWLYGTIVSVSGYGNYLSQVRMVLYKSDGSLGQKERVFGSYDLKKGFVIINPEQIEEL